MNRDPIFDELRDIYQENRDRLTMRHRIAFAVSWLGFQLLRLARWVLG
jgi:hypothetical protein